MADPPGSDRRRSKMGPVIKVDLFGYQSRPFKKLAKNIDDIKYVALRESWFWNLQKLDQEEERAVIGKNNKLRLGWRSTETEGPVLDIKYVALRESWFWNLQKN